MANTDNTSHNCNNFEERHAELFITVSIRGLSEIFSLSRKPQTIFRTRASKPSVLFSTNMYPGTAIFIITHKSSEYVIIGHPNCRFCLFVKSHQRNAVYMESQYGMNNWSFTAYEPEMNVRNNMFDFPLKFLNCSLPIVYQLLHSFAKWWFGAYRS